MQSSTMNLPIDGVREELGHDLRRPFQSDDILGKLSRRLNVDASEHSSSQIRRFRSPNAHAGTCGALSDGEQREGHVPWQSTG